MYLTTFLQKLSLSKLTWCLWEPKNLPSSLCVSQGSSPTMCQVLSCILGDKVGNS